MENNKSVSSGLSFTSLLQVALIVLKLCGVINWSWWLVWLPTLSGVGVCLILLIIWIILIILSKRN